MSFDDIVEKKAEPNVNEAFLKVQNKYDRDSHYPWLIDSTLAIKDIHAFLHNEILDFVGWIEQSQEEKQ